LLPPAAATTPCITGAEDDDDPGNALQVDERVFLPKELKDDPAL